jgi:hypothetical protein
MTMRNDDVLSTVADDINDCEIALETAERELATAIGRLSVLDEPALADYLQGCLRALHVAGDEIGQWESKLQREQVST